MLIKGIRKVLDFALAINKSLHENGNKNLIETFDIGGGLPVSYHTDGTPVSMEIYLSMLRENCRELFDGTFRLITEFGRYVHANTGWVASKVEYVKREINYNIIMTHVGADLLLRECYHPNDWFHGRFGNAAKPIIQEGIQDNKKDQISHCVHYCSRDV